MLRSLATLFVIGVFCWYAVGSAYAAMLMYWWFGIFRPHEWMWWDVSSLRLPLLAAALFVGTAFVKGYRPRLTNPISVLIALFLTMALLAAQNSCVSYEPVTISYLTKLVLFILLTERVLQSASAIWGLVLVATTSLAFLNSKLSYHALLNGFTLYGIPISQGSFSNGNATALGSSMGIFLFFFLIGTMGSGSEDSTPGWLSKRWLRTFTKVSLYVFVIGSLLFIVKSESRGSALSFALGLAVWILLHPRRIKLTATLSLVVTVVLAVGLPEAYKDRIASAFEESYELEDSAASRPHFWATAERMAQANLFGVGIGCFKANYDYYDVSDGRYGVGRSVHSSHYSVLAETGYPGAAVWILLLLTTFGTLLRVRNRSSLYRMVDKGQDFYFKLSNALIASLTVFVAGGNFYEMAYNDYTWLIFAMTIAASRLHRPQFELEQERHGRVRTYGTSGQFR